MSLDDMGGQFDNILTLVQPWGTQFTASGTFDWDDCYVMSIFIYQSVGADSAAASAVGKPTITRSAGNVGQPTWALPMNVVVPKRPDNNLTRLLQPGPALAVAAALITSAGNVRVEQWGQAIKLGK